MIPTPTNDHCTCMEVFGEDVACVIHGRGSQWAHENGICPKCDGSGEGIGYAECEYCHGSGFVLQDGEELPPLDDGAAA